jgi:hypothetical protein
MPRLDDCLAMTIPPRWRAGAGADRLRLLLVAALCFVVYSANARVIPSADTRPARYLPFAVLRDHRLTLEGFAAEVQARAPGQYAVHEVDGRLVSTYPVFAPLAALPLYLPAYLYLDATGWNAAELGFLAALLEKVAAAAFASLAMGCLYLLLRRRLDVRDALILTTACAFGTSTWAISSQALWQHGPAQLALAAALLAATAPPTMRNLSLAGAGAVLLAAMRLPDVLLALPIAVFCLLRAGGCRQRAAVLAGAFVATALVLGCNLAAAGRLAGGSAFHFGLVSPRTYFAHPLFAGLAGELVSPGKGLLVFSPWLLMGLGRRPRRHDADAIGDRRLDWLLGAGVMAQLVLFAKAGWLGGSCYGPRFTTDMLPAVAWILAPALPGIQGRGRLGLWLLIGWSMAVQAVGAFRYPSGRSDAVLHSSPAAPWRPGNAQFLLELRGAGAARTQGLAGAAGGAATDLPAAPAGAATSMGYTRPPTGMEGAWQPSTSMPSVAARRTAGAIRRSSSAARGPGSPR